jgi:hypothetical protein
MPWLVCSIRPLDTVTTSCWPRLDPARRDGCARPLNGVRGLVSFGRAAWSWSLAGFAETQMNECNGLRALPPLARADDTETLGPSRPKSVIRYRRAVAVRGFGVLPAHISRQPCRPPRQMQVIRSPSSPPLSRSPPLRLHCCVPMPSHSPSSWVTRRPCHASQELEGGGISATVPYWWVTTRPPIPSHLLSLTQRRGARSAVCQWLCEMP